MKKGTIITVLLVLLLLAAIVIGYFKSKSEDKVTSETEYIEVENKEETKEETKEDTLESAEGAESNIIESSESTMEETVEITPTEETEKIHGGNTQSNIIGENSTPWQTFDYED